MTAAPPAPERRNGAASMRERIPGLTMRAADALALSGQGIAVCLFGAILAGGGADAALAGVTGAVVAVAVLARRGRFVAALRRAGTWRASVAADALGAVGTFAVLLHLDARADHPLVLVSGVAAAGLGIAAGLLTGPRTPVEPASRPGSAPTTGGRRWPRARLLIGGLALSAGALGTAVLGPVLGWVAFACFLQATEAVVVLVPPGHPELAPPVA